MKSLIYYMHDESTAFRFVLSGDLSLETARDLEQARVTASSVLAERPLIFDLTAVTSIDSGGRQLLSSWHAQGAQLTIAGSAVLAEVQSMTDLPITVRPAGGQTPNWLPPRALALWLAALLSLFFTSDALLANASIPASPSYTDASLFSKCAVAGYVPFSETTICGSQIN